MRCPAYVGVSCVDGSCPMALSEEYAERGIPIIKDCEDCSSYKGCVDCANEGVFEVCPKFSEVNFSYDV